jgi:hypothetical protein
LRTYCHPTAVAGVWYIQVATRNKNDNNIDEKHGKWSSREGNINGEGHSEWRAEMEGDRIETMSSALYVTQISFHHLLTWW